MDKLNTILLNSTLGLISQDTETLEAFSSNQNYLRVVAPYTNEWICYGIFYPTNSDNNVGIPAEYMLIPFESTETYLGSTYYGYEVDFPAAVLGSARANKLDVTIAFIQTDDDLIGVKLYDTTAVGYNETTYIAAQLELDYLDAVATNYVRVFNTETDWVFDGTDWSDTDEITLTNLREDRSDTVSYAIRKGTSTSRPTHAPTATETIIATLNKMILSTTAYATFLTIANANSTFVKLTREIIGIDLSNDISLVDFKTALGNASSTLDGLMSTEDKVLFDAALTNITQAMSDIDDLETEQGLQAARLTVNESDIDDLETEQGLQDGRLTVNEGDIDDLEAAKMFKSASFNSANGVITFTRYDNTTSSIDLPTELIVTSGSYDSTTQDLTLILSSGDIITIPLDDILVGIATQTWVGTELESYYTKTAANVLLDEKLDKDYTNASLITELELTDLISIYNGLAKKITWENFLQEVTTNTGSFSAIVNYREEGLGAYQATFQDINSVTGSAGSYLVDVKDIGDKLWALVLMPDTSADATGTTRISFDNGTTSRYLQINGASLPVAQLSEKLLKVYRNGTILELETKDTEKAILMTKGTGGKFYATVDHFVWTLNNKYTLLFPNTLTDLTTAVTVSLDGEAGTYKSLKYDDTSNNVVVKHTQNLKADVHYDNTNVVMQGDPLLNQSLTFNSVTDSVYGNAKPIKGLSQITEIKGNTFNQPIDGAMGSLTNWQGAVGNTVVLESGRMKVTNDGSYTSRSVDGILINKISVAQNEYVYINAEVELESGDSAFKLGFNIYDSGDNFLNAIASSELTATSTNQKFSVRLQITDATVAYVVPRLQNGVTASVSVKHFDNVMILNNTNTRYAGYSASELDKLIPQYFEGVQSIADFELATRGINLFDKSTVNDGYYINASTGALVGNSVYFSTDYIRVKPDTVYFFNYGVGSGTAGLAYYDINENYISGFAVGGSGSYGTTTISNAVYIRVCVNSSTSGGAIETYQVEENSESTPYVEYNAGLFKLTNKDESTLYLRSVGASVYDIAYLLNDDWWFKQYVGVALEVAIGDVIDTTAIPTIKETTGIFHAYDTVNNEEQYGVYGDTLALTGTATVYFELATPLDAVEIKFSGSSIQEANTTLIQGNDNFGTEYTVKFAQNVNALVGILNEKIKQQRDELDEINGTHIATQLLVLAAEKINPLTSKPDYDYPNMSFLFPQNDTTEIIYAVMFSPDDWVVGTPFNLKTHITQEDSGQAVMKCDYAVYNAFGGTIPSDTTYVMDTYVNTGYVSGSMPNALEDGLEIETPSDVVKAIIRMKIYRDDNAYSGDLKVDAIAVHYTAYNVVKDDIS